MDILKCFSSQFLFILESKQGVPTALRCEIQDEQRETDNNHDNGERFSRFLNEKLLFLT